jgi:hypothetical protein
MTTISAVALDDLRLRLRDALGPESMLYWRFDRAITERDDTLIADVMENLENYPPAVRHEVEEAILGWLFGATDEISAGVGSGAVH